MSIDGIILAGGLSTRAGTHKMVLDIEGKTVIERCIESMMKSCDRLIVVGGYRIDNIREIALNYSKVELVYNENYRDGMFSSVKEGLKRVTGDRFFLTPGDYPNIDGETYRSLLGVKGDVIIPTFKGRKGHPILIDGRFANEIIWNFKYQSLRDFVLEKGFQGVEVGDDGILHDIDTMEDYNLLLKSISNK